MTVVPRRAGCTGMQRGPREFVRGPLAMNGITFMCVEVSCVNICF